MKSSIPVVTLTIEFDYTLRYYRTIDKERTNSYSDNTYQQTVITHWHLACCVEIDNFDV